ncbi:MAG: hypothetical protein WC554_04790 [Clostridia bacterium]
MTLKKNIKIEVKDGYLENIKKHLFRLTEQQLRDILDFNWYPRANQALNEQRKIWDYSYLAYKGIMMWSEINRKRRANQFGIYVNVPRTFMTIQGIRRNFNISKLKVHLEPIPGIVSSKRKIIDSFLNYDIKRGGTFEQIKDAGFYKLLYGNGFMYSYLSERTGKYGNISGEIDEKTAVVKNTLDKKNTIKYFGMVSRAVSPYKVFPDPDGKTHDYNDAINQPCNFTCIRDVKHINTFRRDWKGIIPDKILDDVKPGGKDMTNYEAVRETIDFLFNMDAIRYPGTVGDVISNSKVVKEYDSREYVEERIWIGEDFLIVQAGAGLKFCLISPNPNPKKISNLVKLDDVSIPGEYWSMGEPYIMRYQQIEENRIHNSVLDTLHFAISGMVGINSQYLEDPYDIEIYPQKVWKLKGMPGVKIDEMMQTFQPNSNGIAPAIKFMEEVKKISQSTTSITDFVTGASKSLAGTATESNQLSGASDLAIADKVKEMAGGALTNIAKIFLSMYPVAYSNEEMKIISDKVKIRFVGKKVENMTEKEISKKLEEGYAPNELIFLNDLDIIEPEFFTTGEVSLDRSGKLSQWISAIDYAKGVNEVAYATGDRRRLDIVKMGLMGLENFDVIGNPDDFMMEDMPIKTDEIQLNAELNAQNQNQNKNVVQNKGGAPKKNKIAPPQSAGSRMRQTAQPSNTGKNQLSRKNV